MVERGTPGLGDFKIERKMGLKAYESTSFTLRGCRVPAANLLGGEEHYARRAGFKGAMQSFNATRPAIAAMAVGIGRAALDEALAAPRARAGGSATRACATASSARAAGCAPRGCSAGARPGSRTTAGRTSSRRRSARRWHPAVALEAAPPGWRSRARPAGRGDQLVEKLFRDVKAMDIVEGTGQIQRLVIARQLLGLPRDAGAA